MCSIFFSSRRRHTRYWRDWSSDVCSSDLLVRRERGEDRAELEEVADGDVGDVAVEILAQLGPLSEQLVEVRLVEPEQGEVSGGADGEVAARVREEPLLAEGVAARQRADGHFVPPVVLRDDACAARVDDVEGVGHV